MTPSDAPPNGPEERDASFEAGLAYYVSSVLEIAEAVEDACPDVVGAKRGELIRLALVAGHEDILAAGSAGYVERLSGLATRMQELAKAGNHAQLMHAAGELAGLVQSILSARRQAFARLRAKAGEFQNKLREAEELASLDPLTGVSNRREFERQLASRIAGGTPFCMLLFDLDQFKGVNDQYGHLCGDEVLKQLAQRLSGQVRARDFVCRWGGDEFVVILECGLEHALARARDVARRLAGTYNVRVDHREYRVEISVSVGAAEHGAGETPEQLFRRVDESLYTEKNAQAAG